MKISCRSVISSKWPFDNKTIHSKRPAIPKIAPDAPAVATSKSSWCTYHQTDAAFAPMPLIKYTPRKRHFPIQRSANAPRYKRTSILLNKWSHPKWRKTLVTRRHHSGFWTNLPICSTIIFINADSFPPISPTATMHWIKILRITNINVTSGILLIAIRFPLKRSEKRSFLIRVA